MELIALFEVANAESVFFDNPSAYRKAGKAVLSRLRAVAVEPSVLPTSYES